MSRSRYFVAGPFRLFLSGLLSFSLVISGVPTTAWAEELGADDAAVAVEDITTEIESPDVQEEPVEGGLIVGVSTQDDLIEGEPAQDDFMEERLLEEPALEEADESDQLEAETLDATDSSEGMALTTQSDDIVASGTWGTCPWEIDALGAMTIHPGRGADTTGYDSPWKEYSSIVKSVVFAEENGKKVVAPKSCKYLFNNFAHVKSIDASGFDTSQATNMSMAFYRCYELESLITTGWQVMYVTDMANMFSECNKLATVDVSNWNVANVLNMNYMFSGCFALTDLDVSNWNTINVEEMRGLFSQCSSLKQIDVSGFDVKKDNGSAIDTSYMFNGCESLETIDLSSWGEDTNYYGGYHKEMFSRCGDLKSFTIGSRLPFNKKADIPVPTSSNGMWWSRRDKQWVTVEQIYNTRSRIADTYLNYEGIGFDADVAEAEIVIQDQTYDGTERKPVPIVVLDGNKLINGIDFTVSYSDNVNAGIAHAVIIGRGSYAGEAAYPFTISPKTVTVTANSLSKEWGEADPELTATVSGLIDGDTISYNLLREPGEDAGEYVIAAEGAAAQGNYTITYKRAKLTVNRAIIEVPTPVQLVYNGQMQQGVPEGNGYTLSGTIVGIKADSYTTEVTPDANHRWSDGSTDTKSIGWSIDQRDINEAIVGDFSSQIYTGTYITPEATVSMGDAVLHSGIDYATSYINNIVVGTAIVLLEGTGNYTGTISRTFEIVPANISNTTITAPRPQTYTGKPLTPAVVVRLGDSVLTNGDDYTLEYSNNTNVGAAIISIAGKGNCSGSAKVTFFIVPASIAEAEIATISDQVYTGESIKPTLSVKLGERQLVAGSDYLVTYENNVEIGTASLVVTGMGNYAGTASTTFQIVEPPKVDISEADIELGAPCIYDGTPKKPELNVVLNDTELVAGTDYAVTYEENVSAGTATATLEGRGRFTGTKRFTFKISPAIITEAVVTADDQVYTGQALEPTPAVTLGTVTLKAGSDYDVTYADNINAGIATVTVAGKGNYAGTAKGSFRILELANPFIDVTKSTGHYDDILWLASQGISTGWNTPNGKEFRPYSNVVRADMAAFLFRLAKSWGLVDDSWQPSGSASFLDVTTGTSHYREVMWLAESGISKGWPVGGGKEFRPYATVVRADMAAFLYRLEALREGSNPAVPTGRSPFLDVNAGTAHYNEVIWLASSGVSTGWNVGNGREFRPDNDVVRADMAAFLHRMDGLKG